LLKASATVSYLGIRGKYLLTQFQIQNFIKLFTTTKFSSKAKESESTLPSNVSLFLKEHCFSWKVPKRRPFTLPVGAKWE
jgi:hypothetical protein